MQLLLSKICVPGLGLVLNLPLGHEVHMRSLLTVATALV
jgi:hypothetical protein